MPGKGLVWATVLGTFIMPNYLGAVAWILMAGPNAGWLNRAYIWLTGAAAGPFNVYSKTGLVLVIACYSFPYMFVFTRSALDLISSEMEDAASTLGAGALRTTKTSSGLRPPRRSAVMSWRGFARVSSATPLRCSTASASTNDPAMEPIHFARGEAPPLN